MNVEQPFKYNAPSVKKYFVEYTVLFLTTAVIYLFFQYSNLNNKIIELQTTVIQKNTESNVRFEQQLQLLNEKKL